VTHPYPGAFCFAAGRKLFVWEAAIEAEHGKGGEAGQIIGVGASGMRVAAGAGVVIAKRIQFEGGREIPAGAVDGQTLVEAKWKLV